LDRAIAWQSGSSRADRSLNVVASDRPHRTGGAADGFYRAIALRHTNRYAYERSKAVPADWREFLRRTGDDQGARVILFDEGGDRREFDAAVVEATQAIIDDKTMIADSDRWFRSSAAEIEAYRDGPTLDAAGLSFFALTYARLFSVSPENGPLGLAQEHSRGPAGFCAPDRPHRGQ
jgi:hypothetical protein